MARTAHIPRLRFRPTAPADLPECLTLLPAWLRPDDELRRLITAAWPRLQAEPSFKTTVMEDLALPAGQRLPGWGCGFVLPPEWVCEQRLETQPDASCVRRLLMSLRDGSYRLLSDAEIGALNAREGVHFFNLYVQRDMDLADPYTHSVLNIANEAFRSSASGFNFKAMYFEIGEPDAAVLETAGFHRRHYANESTLEHLSPEQRPALFGITREEAHTGLPGTSVRHVFEHHPPLFRFSLSQRRLLWLALFDENDAYLTERLDVSVHGLKKLWRGIYDRVENRMPEFFGEEPASDDGRRGPEKRRQVLAYVRQRPEELRPWQPAAEEASRR